MIYSPSSEPITIDMLKSMSLSYDRDYSVTHADVKKANELRDIIENTRSNKPVAGDGMIFIGPKKTYPYGHIEQSDLSKSASLCTHPYTAFVSKLRSAKPQVSFDSSGGYWLTISKEDQKSIKHIGTQLKIFKAWGHFGACPNGAFYFDAKVNIWSYSSDSIY